MIKIPRIKVMHLEKLFIYSQSKFYCFRFYNKLAMLSRMQLLSANSVILLEDTD
jgi:hypothetical protein